MVRNSSAAINSGVILPLAALVAILLVLVVKKLQGSGSASSGSGGGSSALALQTCLNQVAGLNSQISGLQTSQAVTDLQLDTCNTLSASSQNLTNFLVTGFNACVTPPAGLLDGTETLICVVSQSLISFDALDTAGSDTGLIVDWSTSCTSSVTLQSGVLACPPSAQSQTTLPVPVSVNCVLPPFISALVCGVALDSNHLIYYDPQSGFYYCTSLATATSTVQNPVASGCECFLSGGTMATCVDVGGIAS